MKLDGREFSVIDHRLTAAQNDYIQAHLALAGVTDLLVQVSVSKPTEEELGAFRRKFITQILLTGQKSFVLAGCLTEKGKKWSRAEAEKNAAIFDDISDPDEVMSMTNSLATIVISFFQSAGTSSLTFPKSSSPSVEDPATESAERKSSGSSLQ